MTDTNILTRTELANNLKVSEKTIQRLERKGLPILLDGRKKRYDYTKVLEWLEESNK